MIVRYPMKLAPCFKDYLWGGHRLKERYEKDSEFPIIAESWELSCREDGVCTVMNGAYAGQTLEQVLKQDPTIVGRRRDYLPIMVKLIDANQPLSIQVHPSDSTALADRGEQGKAEMWFIVEAEPGAFIYCGLKQNITKEEFLVRAKDGSICQVLNKVSVRKNDVFYILPGTIHAIGKGVIIAEIQQNSNTTFRVYDYERRDKNGNTRPLHLKRAADVVDLNPIIPLDCRANSTISFQGYRLTQMFSNKHFQAYRLDVFHRSGLFCDNDSFSHLLFIEGAASIKAGDINYTVKAGESWLIPAGFGQYEIEGKCMALLSTIQEEERE